MEQKMLPRYAIAELQNTQSQYHVSNQVAALEATIAYCQSRREQHGRVLRQLFSELQTRKFRPN